MRGIVVFLIFVATVLICGFFTLMIRSDAVGWNRTHRRTEIIALAALEDPVAMKMAPSMPLIFNQMRKNLHDKRYRATTVSQFLENSRPANYSVIASFCDDEDVTDFYWSLASLDESDRKLLAELDAWHSNVAGGNNLTEVLLLPRNKATATLMESARAERTIPPEPEYFAFDSFWLWAYMIMILVFAIFMLLIMLIVESVPRWSDFGTKLVLVLIFPVTVTVLVIAYLIRFVVAVANWRFHPISWTVSFFKAAWSALFRGLYRLHILRRMPTPVLKPVTVNSATVGVAVTVCQENAETNVTEPKALDEDIIEGAKWYAFEMDVVYGRRKQLQKAEIPIFPIKIDSPYECKLYAVQGEDIDKFEKLLGFDMQPALTRHDRETDIESTVWRRYDRLYGELDYIRQAVETDDDEDREVQTVFRTVAPILRQVSAAAAGKDILFIEGDGQHINELDYYDQFVVLYNIALPEHPGNIQQIFLNDDQREVRLTGFGPRNDSFGELFEDEGVPLVQLAGNVVTVLFPVLELGQVGRELLASQLIQAITAWYEAENADDAVKARRWKEFIDLHERNYIELRMKSLSVRKNELKNSISGQENAIKEAEKIIVQSVRERAVMFDELKRLETCRLDEERRRIHEEFKQMAASPNVVSIRATADVVYVETKTIYIKHAGKKYKIGRFRIALHNDGRVRFKNIQNAAVSMVTHPHPHVYREGNACFGNVSGAISKLMASREYAAVIGILFRFLQSYNARSPVRDISNWRVVQDD